VTRPKIATGDTSRPGRSARQASRIAAGQDPGGVAFADIDEPAPGPDQAIVEVAAFSGNRGETYQLDRPRPGWRPGKDVAGVVTAAADGSGLPPDMLVVGHADRDG
jgi:NADPH:quinone reductase-like Zn-dependent oxidoreductase